MSYICSLKLVPQMTFCRKIAFLAIIFAVFSSCSSEDITTKILEVNVSETYGLYDGSWIVISTPSGEVIAHQLFKRGDQMVLNTNKEISGNKVTVTILKFVEGNINIPSVDSYGFTSYTNIEVGSTLNLEFYAPENPPATGQASLELLNFPVDASLDEQLNITSLNGKVGIGGTTIQENNVSNWDLVVSLPQEPSDVFISITANENPMYHKIDAMNANASISIDFNTNLRVLDNVYSLTFPTLTRYSVIILGYDSEFQSAVINNSHIFSCASLQQEPVDIKIGYNNGYEFYQSLWTWELNDKQANYVKVGNAPTLSDFSVPDFNITILDPDFNSFSYQKAFASDFLTVDWRFKNTSATVWWTVNGPLEQNQQIINQIPDEIIGLYPQLSTYLDGLTLLSTKFYQSKSNFEYGDFLQSRFSETSTYLFPKEYLIFTQLE